MIKLTNLEFAVLQAIDRSEYGDVIMDDIWTFSVWDNIDHAVCKSARSIPGVVASLLKKGLVRSGAGSGGDDLAWIGMTRDGMNAYLDSCVTRTVKHNKRVPTLNASLVD